jgi:hypothetical protein
VVGAFLYTETKEIKEHPITRRGCIALDASEDAILKGDNIVKRKLFKHQNI